MSFFSRKRRYSYLRILIYWHSLRDVYLSLINIFFFFFVLSAKRRNAEHSWSLLLQSTHTHLFLLLHLLYSCFSSTTAFMLFKIESHPILQFYAFIHPMSSPHPFLSLHHWKTITFNQINIENIPKSLKPKPSISSQPNPCLQQRKHSTSWHHYQRQS